MRVCVRERGSKSDLVILCVLVKGRLRKSREREREREIAQEGGREKKKDEILH